MIKINYEKNKLILKVPDDIKNEFDILVLKENYAKAMPVIIALYAIEWILYLFSEQLYNTGKIILCFQFFNTIMIPILFMVNKYLEKIPRMLSKGLLNTFSLGVLLFGLALVMVIQNEIDLIHMFMMCALGVAAFVVMTPLESFIIYFISMVLFWIVLPIFQADYNIIFVQRVNTTIFIFIVWIMAIRFFQYKVRDYLINADLLNKNSILEELVQLDQMTGLLNHKTILDKLEEEIIRSRRFDNKLSVVIMDIDNFKSVNDRFGHQMGDEILINLSGNIKQIARETDMVGRYGGEEFMVIMPDTDLNAAFNYCKRLKESNRKLLLPDNSVVTISGGIIQFDGESLGELIRKVDTKLYRAKNNGKNQFVYKEHIG